MTTPIAQRIIEAVRDRLYVIAPANDYNTDPRILTIGAQPTQATDIDCDFVIGVWEQADAPGDLALDGAQLVTQNIVIEGLCARRYEADELALLHLLWQDIVRAVFLASDPTLGGLALSVQRGSRTFVFSQAGEGFAGVLQLVEVTYHEPYGNP